MPRTTLVLATLTLAILTMASPILATAQSPHADDPGPPDHAAAPDDTGPPDDARIEGGDEAASPRPASTDPAGEGEAAEEPSDPTSEDEEVEEPTAGSQLASDGGDEPEATEGVAEPVEPSTRTAPVETGTGATTSLPATDASTPSAAGTSSSTAPGLGGAVKLLGPMLVVSVLGVGLVARARVPEGPPSGDGEDPNAGEENTGGSQPVDEDPELQTGEPVVPTPGPVGLLTLGRRALDRGHVEAAADWFHTAALVDPSRQVAHFCLGLCLAELDRLEEAEAALAEARRLQPRDVEAAYAHAQVLARRGSTCQALATLESLADEMPNIAQRLRDDEDWAALHDHPRWLALTGELPDLTPGGFDEPTP